MLSKDQFFVLKKYISDFLEFEYADEIMDAETIQVLRDVVNRNMENINEYELSIIKGFLIDTVLYDGLDNAIELAEDDDSKKILEVAREICD